jgi:hypothetical protein
VHREDGRLEPERLEERDEVPAENERLGEDVSDAGDVRTTSGEPTEASSSASFRLTVERGIASARAAPRTPPSRASDAKKEDAASRSWPSAGSAVAVTLCP